MAEAHLDFVRGDVGRQEGAADLRVLERGSLQIQVSEVAAAKIRIPEISIAEDEPTLIDFAEIGATKVRATEVDGISFFDALMKLFDLADTQQSEGGILQESWHGHFFDLDSVG